MALLRKLVPHVVELPASTQHPDCVFIEDTALSIRECAVVCRPGAPTRQGEEVATRAALFQLLPVKQVRTVRASGRPPLFLSVCICT